ncbi:response regulator [Metallumcola ferriviriculae]|uniref:Stage 0 sporulation protein A homolog n=1 Tax=Metallumcola ferriviriculae TaxID=3039180 RepID=A0AAU0UVU4_9FIRM|nr:response regulator [Desulfitibacteraceae bacterium MK1]
MTKILIIDDEEDIRYTLKEICSLSGWNTCEAVNGNMGLKLFKKERPDLVLVDYHMPELDGLATVKALRKLSTEVPIIVLTVDERQQVADTFLDAGASDFALKPIKAPDLISRLKVHLSILKSTQGQVEDDDVYTVKGISKATLKLVVDYLKTCSNGASIEEITDGVCLAYPTVHRYLMYLVDRGDILVQADYGKVGRPKNRYYNK